MGRFSIFDACFERRHVSERSDHVWLVAATRSINNQVIASQIQILGSRICHEYARFPHVPGVQLGIKSLAGSRNVLDIVRREVLKHGNT